MTGARISIGTRVPLHRQIENRPNRQMLLHFIYIYTQTHTQTHTSHGYGYDASHYLAPNMIEKAATTSQFKWNTFPRAHTYTNTSSVRSMRVSLSVCVPNAFRAILWHTNATDNGAKISRAAIECAQFFEFSRSCVCVIAKVFCLPEIKCALPARKRTEIERRGRGAGWMVTTREWHILANSRKMKIANGH